MTAILLASTMLAMVGAANAEVVPLDHPIGIDWLRVLAVMMGTFTLGFIIDWIRHVWRHQKSKTENGDVNMFDWVFDRTLRVAAGAGAALGIAFGYGQWCAHGPKGLVAHGLVYWLENQFMDALIWAILGGFVAGAVVYGYRTLTKKEGEQNN
jgi:hypothetical protein